MDSYGQQMWPIVVYFSAIVLLLGFMLVLSHYIGPKSRGRDTYSPYESGILSVGDARVKFKSHFFVYAIFFVIFDLEAVFLFAWAIAFDEAGVLGFIEALIFVLILLLGLVYLWRLGALDLHKRHSQEKP